MESCGAQGKLILAVVRVGYLEIAGAEDAADGARRSELEEVAGGRGRGGGERWQRQLVMRGRGGGRQEAIAAGAGAEGHVGQLEVHRQRVGADAPLYAVVVGRRQRRRGVAGRRRRRRERANIAIEVPRRGGSAGDLRRHGDGQRGGEARRVLMVHEGGGGVAIGRRRRGGGGVTEHG